MPRRLPPRRAIARRAKEARRGAEPEINSIAFRDPETGERTEDASYEHHIWDVDKVREIAASEAVDTIIKYIEA
jgi:hypothetical protein